MRARAGNAVVVGGSGGFGRHFVRLLGEAGLVVTAVDQDGGDAPRTIRADATRAHDDVTTELARCDLLVLCLPERALFEALPVLLPPLPPGALVVDVTSVKSRYADAVRMLRDDLELCSLEPMFAPDTGFAGQDLLVATLQDGPRTADFLELIRGWDARIRLVTVEDIDRQAAVTQVAAHAALLSYGAALSSLGFDPTGPTTALQRVLLTMLARVATRDPDTYWHVQRDNPHAAQARQTVVSHLRELADTVDRGDQAVFTADLAAIAEALGPALDTYATRAGAVVAAAGPADLSAADVESASHVGRTPSVVEPG